MREGDPVALRGFFERFAPLLLAIAARDVPPDDPPHDTIAEVLGDVAMHLMRRTLRPGSSVENYVVRSFHNRLGAARAEAGRQARALAEEASLSVPGDDVVRASCSEHALRSARGNAEPDDALHPAIAGLHDAMVAAMTADELRLMHWIAEYVSQREAAEWMDTSHGALRAELNRLRARLARAAVRYAMTLPPEGREVVRRFLAKSDLRAVAAAMASRADRTRSEPRPDGPEGRGSAP